MPDGLTSRHLRAPHRRSEAPPVRTTWSAMENRRRGGARTPGASGSPPAPASPVPASKLRAPSGPMGAARAAGRGQTRASAFLRQPGACHEAAGDSAAEQRGRLAEEEAGRGGQESSVRPDLIDYALRAAQANVFSLAGAGMGPSARMTARPAPRRPSPTNRASRSGRRLARAPPVRPMLPLNG